MRALTEKAVSMHVEELRVQAKDIGSLELLRHSRCTIRIARSRRYEKRYKADDTSRSSLAIWEINFPTTKKSPIPTPKGTGIVKYCQAKKLEKLIETV